ncbi:hypothetical protein FR932_12380 [Moritella marina ATCC 15381]|uniref:Uncharacterized protein n=1 Tax=Moritella marina ATCC 15381 TaxID=1202962 RepID=A0A5J6WNV6_MORMI|nr:hypothetical protein [Moritella marina]QFI38585.1 hypothetical protein FR932_12380 [Moritella marina ATCC 15381]
MNSKVIKFGLILAALVNIAGVLTFSQLFSNTAINEADPIVMSNFGLVMIMVWGLAYFAAAMTKGSIRLLVSAFAVEKLVYVCAWVYWLATNNLFTLYEIDLLAGIFYTIYGLNDLVFMVFFIKVAMHKTGNAETKINVDTKTKIEAKADSKIPSATS